jgi:hypothetical protein
MVARVLCVLLPSALAPASAALRVWVWLPDEELRDERPVADEQLPAGERLLEDEVLVADERLPGEERDVRPVEDERLLVDERLPADEPRAVPASALPDVPVRAALPDERAQRAGSPGSELAGDVAR